VIRIENLRKRFGRVNAVDGVTLDIAPGDSVALWGANGAGKTTIIRCVLGLLRYQGRITVGGHDARRDGKRARRLIGYVPQELGFYDDLRVDEAVTFFARLKAVRDADPDAVLAAVGLENQGAKRVRELSGGMKQRLALAVALLGDPPVLVLDEVTASLDACGRDDFVALLTRLKGGGKSLLFASHRAEEVTTLAGRVVLLDKGRVSAELRSSEFLDRLGGQTVMHLHVAEASRPAALSLLRTRGFDARLNGVGVMVHLPASQKAAPMRVLAESRIFVEDFECLSGSIDRAKHPPEAES